MLGVGFACGCGCRRCCFDGGIFMLCCVVLSCVGRIFVDMNMCCRGMLIVECLIVNSVIQID